MFATLGEIVFDVLDSPESFETFRAYHYAEHRVVENKPRLQWVGDGLMKLRLELMLHAAFTDPQAQLAALQAAATDHQARALVFGDGEHRGYFVITELATLSRHLGPGGEPIAIIVRITLMEWANDPELNPSLPPVPMQPPLAIATGSDLLPGGVTPLLFNLLPVGALIPDLDPADVPTGAIVRRAA